MDRRPYKPSPGSRARAFLLTDRMGQTLAATLGLASVARWWLRKRITRPPRKTR